MRNNSAIENLKSLAMALMIAGGAAGISCTLVLLADLDPIVRMVLVVLVSLSVIAFTTGFSICVTTLTLMAILHAVDNKIPDHQAPSRWPYSHM